MKGTKTFDKYNLFYVKLWIKISFCYLFELVLPIWERVDLEFPYYEGIDNDGVNSFPRWTISNYVYWYMGKFWSVCCRHILCCGSIYETLASYYITFTVQSEWIPCLFPAFLLVLFYRRPKWMKPSENWKELAWDYIVFSYQIFLVLL